jgi:hypothetical protein
MTTYEKSVGLLDIHVGMIDKYLGEVVAYERIADHATITFADGTIKHVGWGYRLYII